MNKEQAVAQMTDTMAKFVAYSGKVLPDDVYAKLEELREKETSPLAKTIYDTMFKNQTLAKELDRPCCQDTGVLQFFVKCGVHFPLIGELEALLKEAVIEATIKAPLRHNSVETFDEYNTGKNVGKGTPTVFWEIVPDCVLYRYIHGGRRLYTSRKGHGADAGSRIRGSNPVRHGRDDQLWTERMSASSGGRRCGYLRGDGGPAVQEGVNEAPGNSQSQRESRLVGTHAGRRDQ